MFGRRRLRPRRLVRWLERRGAVAELLGLGSSDREDLVWEARSFIASGRYADANRLAELLATLWPDADVEAALIQGVCSQLRGALEVAEERFDKALESEPENVYALANRAEVRLLKGRNREAAADLGRAEGSGLYPSIGVELTNRIARLRELVEAES
ncbi:hypothetical protein ACYOEI_17300 [Singulisphaera rosea]